MVTDNNPKKRAIGLNDDSLAFYGKTVISVAVPESEPEPTEEKRPRYGWSFDDSVHTISVWVFVYNTTITQLMFSLSFSP